MAKAKKEVNYPIFFLRIGFGALFLYAGLSKVMDPEWTAAGYLGAAQTFPDLYAWFASEANIVWVNFLNQWGLTLIGLGLLTGTLTRLAAYFAILLNALYYFPILAFPYVGEHSYIVDEHIIYILALVVLARSMDRHLWGVDNWLCTQKKLKGWWF